MIHELKTWPDDFQAVADGLKTHEARCADRPFKVGDVLLLREWRPFIAALCHWRATRLLGRYTGRSLVAKVTHLTRGQYGLPPDLAIMSIRVER